MEDVTAEECRKVLNDVVRIINRSIGSPNALAFRDIITALRGPDDESAENKQTYTVPLRGEIGINPYKSGLASKPGSICSSSRLYMLRALIAYEKGPVHFLNHIHRAYIGLEQLGFKVDRSSDQG